MSYVERFINKHCPEILKGIVRPGVYSAYHDSGCVLSRRSTWPHFRRLPVRRYHLALQHHRLLRRCRVCWLPAFHHHYRHQHYGFFSYFLNEFTTKGVEPFYCISNYIMNISMGAASLAVAIRTRNKEAKSTYLAAAFTAIVAGVSEPALFGVAFRYRKALFCSMIGCFIGGALAGLLHVMTYIKTLRSCRHRRIHRRRWHDELLLRASGNWRWRAGHVRPHVLSHLRTALTTSKTLSLL